jgi:hypothetical protein
MNKGILIPTMLRCLSDLECWVDGNMESYDPFIKDKAGELAECIDISKQACKHISTSIDNLSSLTSREKLAMRQCLIKCLTIIHDEDIHKKIDSCLVILRKT